MLSRKKKKQIAVQLRHRKEDLLKEIQSHHDAMNLLERSRPIELSEEAQEEAAELSLKSLDEQERKELQEVERALEKLEKGTYAICEGCGTFISPARIDALPAARFCFSCQEAGELSPASEANPPRQEKDRSRIRSHRSVLFFLFFLGAWAAYLWSAQSANLPDIMHMKLEHAHKLLDSIVLEDFQEAARHSKRLEDLARASEWNTVVTPKFKHFTEEFQRSAAALTQAAEDRDVDSAALAYIDLTLNCLGCHKHVRGARRAGLE